MVIVTGQGVDASIATTEKVSLVIDGHGQRSRLDYAAVKKWLGLPWPINLNFTCGLEERIGIAGQSFATLAGLVADRSLPLPLAIVIFRGKVDGVLQFGRWLLAFSPGASERLDEVYASWARGLFGAPSWRNGAVAQWELGWSQSGYARAVASVASRRAAVQCWPEGDVLRRIVTACAVQGSW